MTYTVAVRTLCDFTARQGDLDMRFTPAPTALEGIAGHKLVASRRPPHYQSEVVLAADFEGVLRVRGRADGYDPQTHTLEEIKTFRGELARKPENQHSLHWAQLKIYGWLLCLAQRTALGADEAEKPCIQLALVYLDLATLEETTLVESHTPAALHAFFNQQCALFLQWAQQEMAHRSARDAALEASGSFPLGNFRPGQRELAEAVYRSAKNGHCLLAQAPTGIGKTMATVFGVLKAMPAQKIDKLFFLTAKTSGRDMALEALHTAALHTAAPLRVLELVAKAKVCEHPDKACQGDSCPLAQGFYDRLPAARQQAVAPATALPAALLSRAVLRQTALQHGICPYYLAQDLLRWSDAVVGDYNYYFDYSALLYSQMLRQEWRVSVLADEAHNLVERARSMYSAELNQASIQAVFAQTPKALRGVLLQIDAALSQLHQAAKPENYLPLDEPPQAVVLALKQALAAFGDFGIDSANSASNLPAPVLELFFKLLHFARMAESFGEHSVMSSARLETPVLEAGSLLAAASPVRLAIDNVLPACFLKKRLEDAHSATLFSATLLPKDYFLQLLGLPQSTRWLDVPSPFGVAQLRLEVVADLSNVYRHRDQALQPMANIMARQFRQTPGNYLVFSSSYALQEKLLAVFRKSYPSIACWQQTQNMDEAAQSRFVERFCLEGKGLAFAVLGGAFGEGIDLPGTRLVGAFVANLGLSPQTPLNQQIEKALALHFGKNNLADFAQPDQSDQLAKTSAYDSTYTFPAMQRVVQAAGRVIRTLSDTGIVVLMDQRFAHPKLQRLMPAWWQITLVSKNPKQHQQQHNRNGNTQKPSNNRHDIFL